MSCILENQLVVLRLSIGVQCFALGKREKLWDGTHLKRTSTERDN